MVTVAFDTLEFVETLKQAGITETQAKAIATAVRDSHETAELATKADLLSYESAIRRDFEKLEITLHHELKDLSQEMRMLGLRLVIALGGIVVATVSALPVIFKIFHLI